MPDVYWLIKAQRRFLEAMIPPPTAGAIADTFTNICGRLAATFPEAASVIVRDRLRGYRNYRDRHILLVEVIHRTRRIKVTPEHGGPQGSEGGTECTIIWPEFCEPIQGERTQSTAHIVKIAADPKILADELDSWEKCRPVGMTHDSILMRLRAGARGSNGELLSILYEDAHHVIGSGTVISLEEAVIDCCVWGTPTVASIELLIRVLYEHFGDDFYTRSWVVDKPDENFAKLRAWKKFDTWLKEWEDSLKVGDDPQLHRKKIRREVLGTLSSRRNCLIDPIDYLGSVQKCPQYCPLLLWGCSDGDLHGRNVLVTVLDDAVTLPAVFDYADMGLENLVGWDFVKLETELKVRVLPQLLDGPEADYLFTVLKFECFLASSTNAMHDQKELPKAAFKSEGLNRLATILVAIRRQAQRHLGVQRLRDRQWLEEYYFLLACYGAYAGLFDTYQTNRRQIAAAYLSAGVAARQLARPTQKLDALIRQAEVKAKEMVEHPGQNFAPASYKLTRDKCEMSYHMRLAFARTWMESKESAYLQGAIAILERLREDYPHVLEIEDELALAHLEAGDVRAFEVLLVDVNARYSQLSEELLCRIGRSWKDKADLDRSTDLGGAKRSYDAALDWYRKAHAIRTHYYPGINVAALEYVLGNIESAKKAAEAVLRSLEGPTPAEEQVWVRASQADARLLLDEHEEAERLYRRARSLASPRGVAAMLRQVKMLVAYAPDLSPMKTYWTPERLVDVFGP
jgi:hypothetical protein